MTLVKEYREALQEFRSGGRFREDELEYLGRVYERLIDKSLASLDALVMVITSSRLRMSDDERLQTIDKVYRDVSDQLSFLRFFNNEARMLSLNRKAEEKETKELKLFYGE